MEKVERLLLKPLDAAAMLSIGRSKIYEMIYRGDIPSVRVGGMIRVPLSAVEKFAHDAKATTESVSARPADRR
jgi:excisionase family DNA binding protein